LAPTERDRGQPRALSYEPGGFSGLLPPLQPIGKSVPGPVP